MQLLDGRLVAEKMKKDICLQVSDLKKKKGRKPHLAAILVGNDLASQTYVNSKIKSCQEIGFQSSLFHYDSQLSEVQLLSKIEELNQDQTVDGFIVQLPLPRHIDAGKVINAIDFHKDVDGFHPVNLGRMQLNLPCFIPATPYGIMILLQHYHIKTEGKYCSIVGRSNIVGRPMSILMSRNTYPGNCTVTLCHSKTMNLKDFTSQADILISAIGQPGSIRADMVKEGAVVIDVGISRVKTDHTKSGYCLKGDVDFQEVSPKVSFITPVPGGVGPMTIVGLLKNTLSAALREFY